MEAPSNGNDGPKRCKAKSKRSGEQCRRLAMIGKEVWKDWPGDPGFCQVSNRGRVRSMPRAVSCRDGITRCYRGTILKPMPRAGYLRVEVGGRTVNLSRMVLETFVGPCPEGMECCHDDGDPTNNFLTNLRWDTPAGNYEDRVRHGTDNGGEKGGTAKLTDADARRIRELFATGDYTLRHLASRYGVHGTTIMGVVKGTRFTRAGGPVSPGPHYLRGERYALRRCYPIHGGLPLGRA